VLANCRLFVGNVGFLMHLARAVECPSVIIFGGREAPWQSGYSCNANLYSPESCAPCWLWNRCDYDRICMNRITAANAVQAVEQLLATPRNPLAMDQCTL
jgi:ADP-heptose:LPS heptosyltransferase